MDYLKMINGGTKKASYYRDVIMQYYDEDFDIFSIPDLTDCYKNVSFAQFDAYHECMKFSRDYVDFLNSRGWNATIDDMGVISHNSKCFTFASIIRVYCADCGYEDDFLYFKAIVITPTKKFIVIL